MAHCGKCQTRHPGSYFCPTCGDPLAPDPGGELALDDRYRLLRLVAEGAMGVVYEAEHIHLKRKVAVKLLRPELAGEHEMVQRFLREAQATSSIGHPNIVDVHDCRVLPSGPLYLTMEWLDGPDLAQRLSAGSLSLELSIDIALQILAGLSAAHQIGIIHRDLKPANVILVPVPGDEGPLVKLVDFGIAKLLGDDSNITVTGTMMGTPHYLSPEQAYGEAVDVRSDLYSLGVILYQMITGTLLFDADTPMLVIHKHATEKPEPPSSRVPGLNIPAGLEGIIMRCLAKKREDRWQSADELATALGYAQRGLASTVESRVTAPRLRTVPPVHIDDAVPADVEDEESARTMRMRPSGKSAKE